MAYLYQQNIVDLVVTEDSDALLTGCGRVCIYIYLMIVRLLGFHLVSLLIGRVQAES
jgi:5'-3' exonuclease